MALAYLKYTDTDGSFSHFEADLGKNRYFTYAVGDDETERIAGLKILRNRTVTSPVMGPIPASLFGRTKLQIPNHLLDTKNRFVQLMSFRTRSRTGPALSNIVQVIKSPSELKDLPALSFTRRYTMENLQVRKIPFKYREMNVSHAFFWDALSSIIPKILPQVGNIIGGLLGGGSKKTNSTTTSPTNGASAVPNILNTLTSSENIKLLTELLKQLAGKNGASPPAIAQSKSLERYPAYSEAKFAPLALLANPAVMSILGKVLNPQTINAILQNINPAKLIGTVASGIKDIANIAVKADEAEMKHLRELNPGVDDAALDTLLQGMSFNFSKNGLPEYRRVDSVKLDFADSLPIFIYGRTRAAYLINHDLNFSMQVEIPRMIGKATLFLTVKDSTTMDVLIQKKYPLTDIIVGQIPVPLQLTASQINGLQSNEDYLLCATLLWKNKSGKTMGTSNTQLITLVDEFSFDRVEPSGEIIPLNDVDQFRNFWHNSWQGQLTPEQKRIEFDSKYFYSLATDSKTNARMETLTSKTTNGAIHQTIRLKTGMELSPFALNQLLPVISKYPMLNDKELKALQSPDFLDRFNMAARSQFKFRGRSGSRVALWHYPEVKIQRIILKKAQQTNENGQVTEMADHPVYFPMPALVHFIGTRTKR